MDKKKIHYCWFGHNPKTELIENCLHSWKTFCPDCEIIEWNEANFDINCCDYVREAYEAKKWAYVSDYCRFYVLYQHGGIYLDTDVELLKPLDTLPDTFVGFENRTSVASGLIRGAKPGDKLCKEMMESYESDHYLLPDGTFNTETVCRRETGLLQQYGLKLNNTLQKVGETWIYPSEYFCPKDYLTEELNITEHTYSIHHYDASWYTEEDKIAALLRTKYRKYMPAQLALRLSKFVVISKLHGLNAAVAETMRFLKRRK